MFFKELHYWKIDDEHRAWQEQYLARVDSSMIQQRTTSPKAVAIGTTSTLGGMPYMNTQVRETYNNLFTSYPQPGGEFRPTAPLPTLGTLPEMKPINIPTNLQPLSYPEVRPLDPMNFANSNQRKDLSPNRMNITSPYPTDMQYVTQPPLGTNQE